MYSPWPCLPLGISESGTDRDGKTGSCRRGWGQIGLQGAGAHVGCAAIVAQELERDGDHPGCKGP